MNFIYTGSDVLELMAEARNYNKFLSSLVKKYACGAEYALDFGAGIGTFAVQLRNQGIKVSCVELDEAQREGLTKIGFDTFADLDDLPDEAFQYIYSLNVLEHIENDQAAISKLAKKLSGGGKLLVYVPAFNLLYSSFDRLVGHQRRYSAWQLRNLLDSAGIKIEIVNYVDSIGFFAALAYRMLDDGNGKINRKALIIFDRVLFPISILLDRMGFSRLFGKNILVVGSK